MKKRNIVIMLLLVLGLLSITLGVTVAFFNYTRTGSENTIAVGRIYFTSSQSGFINLSNVFPISSEQALTDTENTGSVSITVRGDTDYYAGVEYLISVVDVNNETSSGKRIPVNLDITVNGNGLGTEDEDYYDNRESYTTSKYMIDYTGILKENAHILVGYIAPNTVLGTREGVEDTISIRVYLDKNRIGISDTYYGVIQIPNDGDDSGNINNHSSNLNKINPRLLAEVHSEGPPDEYGTTEDWVNNRVILTTDEWNTLFENGISFKIKIEANEGIWVDKEHTKYSCFTTTPIFNSYLVNNNMTNEELNACVDYFKNNIGFQGDEEEIFDFCNGTGSNDNTTFQDALDNNNYDGFTIKYFLEHNIIFFDKISTSISDYDYRCGTDVIIPNKITAMNKKYKTNDNMTSDELNACVEYFTETGLDEELSEGNTLESFCNGTDTINDYYFQDMINEFSYNNIELFEEFFEELINENVIIEQIEQNNNVAILSIDKNAFNGKGLTSVVIPSGVTIIDDSAFSNNQLTNIIIPDSVIEIGNGAFMNNKLQNLTILGDDVVIGEGAFQNNKFTNINITNNIKSIGSEAFSGNNISLLTIDMTNIPDYFLPNQNIRKAIDVILGENVRTIGNYALSYKLANVTIGNGVTSIGDSAFAYSQLTNVTIPNSVTSIGRMAFSDSKLTSVTIGNGVTTIGSYAFYRNKLTSVEIPNSVTSLGQHAFEYNQLTDIIISNSITVIDYQVFAYNQLTNVVIPSSVTTIEDYAFSNNQLTNVVIPSSVTSIDWNAFQTNKLSNLTIPNSVSDIGPDAFSNNPLVSVTIDKSCSIITRMKHYKWGIPNTATIYGTNNEICT